MVACPAAVRYRYWENKGRKLEKLPTPNKRPGNWVQTERAAHEAWASLIAKNANAARVMHLLVSQLGEHNAVVISQKNLAKLVGVTDRTVRNSLKLLRAENWIEIRQIGQNGTVNAYVVNDRIAWQGKRDAIRYSLFSATVIASTDEQPDVDSLGQQEPLRKLPQMGERQLPSGDGLAPPSQPFLDGMEIDLPAVNQPNENLHESKLLPKPKRTQKAFRLKNGEDLINLEGRSVIAKTNKSYIGDDPDTGEPLFFINDIEYLELTPDVIRERLIANMDNPEEERGTIYHLETGTAPD